MGLRDWAADAVENGDTLRWLLGLGIQFGVEAIASILFGYIGAHAFLFVFSSGAISQLVGGGTFEIIWAAATVLLFVEGTLGEYARRTE